MLVPFVILELPLGKLADKKLGEKELMTGGFIWLAVSTAILSFVETPFLILWAILLLLTRVGASTVEIMTETYFFKKIDEHDSDLLGFFRMVQPASYVIAPIIASIVLMFVDFRWLFMVLGIICLYGIRWSLSLKDTL
jgi:MFS family permease